MIVLPLYGLFLYRARVKRGVITKARALGQYAVLVIAPVVFYALFFFALIGLHEYTDIDLLPEILGRTFIIVIALGILVWIISVLIMGGVLFFLKKRDSVL